MTFPFEQEVILENPIALLRPLKLEDFNHLINIAVAEKELLQFSPKPIYSRELLSEYIKTAIGGRKDKNRYTFIIEDKRTHQFAGCTSFLNISQYDNRLEIGSTWLGKNFQKTGLNRNCKFLLLRYAFEELQIERVEFKTDERNIASREALQKIGGKQEGILRSHTLMYDGFRRNTVYFSILKNEWPQLKQGFLKESSNS